MRGRKKKEVGGMGGRGWSRKGRVREELAVQASSQFLGPLGINGGPLNVNPPVIS